MTMATHGLGMEIEFGTDEEGRMWVGGSAFIDPDELPDMDGVPVVDRRDGANSKIGEIESTEYEGGKLMATVRLKD